MAAVAGALCAAGLALFAAVRARGSGGYYDADVYGMNAQIHRRWAAAWLVFVAAFLVCALELNGLVPWLFAPFALAAVLYLSSFLRGYANEDE